MGGDVSASLRGFGGRDVIRLRVQGPTGHEQEVNAIIDTGFNGFLTLPPLLIAALGLARLSRGRAVLANGSEELFDIHGVTVLWDGQVLGLERLPDVATVSRLLAWTDPHSVANLRQMCRQLVTERLASMDLRRLTLDFDGSVISTGRYAEGTAVGFNRQKKGQRSYYPLFCTVAQTSQVFDVHHRPGNVHDSNGAQDFILGFFSGEEWHPYERVDFDSDANLIGRLMHDIDQYLVRARQCRA